ncbi:hypothetical protein G3I51_13405 [Streptomyces sp. SID9944]|nr:hypothetical protein [Streptomyces sp. SID9944]
MNIEGIGNTNPISSQGDATDALVALIETFGHLPSAYIKIHAPVRSFAPARLALQFDSPQAFELWRTALAVPPSGVALHAVSDEYVWLDAAAVFRGVRVELTGFGVPLSAELANRAQVADEVSSAVAA